GEHQSSERHDVVSPPRPSAFRLVHRKYRPFPLASIAPALVAGATAVEEVARSQARSAERESSRAPRPRLCLRLDWPHARQRRLRSVKGWSAVARATAMFA